LYFEEVFSFTIKMSLAGVQVVQVEENNTEKQAQEEDPLLKKRLSSILDGHERLSKVFTLLDTTREFSLQIPQELKEEKEPVTISRLTSPPEKVETTATPAEPKHIFRVESLQAGNPFLDPLPAKGSCWGTFKLIFFTVTFIAPIRLFLCGVCLLFVVLISLIVTLGHTNSNEPLSCWQKGFKVVVLVIVRGIIFILGYYWIPINGKLDPSARIVVGNHVSAIDGALVCWMACWSGSMGMSALAKIEAFKQLWGIIGMVFKMNQFIGVDRSSKESRAEVLELITARVQNSEMPPLLIFPEGTTHAPRFLVGFKRGAFYTGFPVQPVCLSFLNSKAGGGQLMKGLFWSFYLPCCNFINYAKIDVLPLYEPSSEEIKDPELYASNVQSVLFNELKKHIDGCEISLKGFEDVRLENKLSKLGAVCDLDEETQKHFMRKIQNLIMTELYMKIGIKTRQTVEYMTMFQKLLKQASHQESNLYFEDLKKILGTVNEQQIRKIMKFLDTKENGYIGPLEFIMFISTVQGTNTKAPTALADELYIIFCCIDTTCSGSITLEELTSYTENEELAISIVQNTEKKVTFDDFLNDVQGNSEVLTVLRAQMKKMLNEAYIAMTKD